MANTTLPMGARGLKKHLDDHLTPDADIVFAIGHPAAPIFAVDSSGTSPNFSIYFYKIVPARNSGVELPGRPLDTVAHCLLTPLARRDDRDTWTFAGERDLDMLGNVMQVLHGKPHFHVIDAAGKASCEVEVIPQELTLEELNKIVPAPPEGGFRPSAAYLISLLPIDPIDAEREAPLVKTTTYTLTRIDESASPKRVTEFRGQRVLVDTTPDVDTGDMWQPHVYLLDGGGRPCDSWVLVPQGDQAQANVLIVGSVLGAAVTLSCTRWNPELGRYEEEAVVELSVKTNAVDLGESSYQGHPIPLSSRVSSQYLFRARRVRGDRVIWGKGCLLTIDRESGS